jgi:transcriptional regulator with XRE-family HTH domain
MASYVVERNHARRPLTSNTCDIIMPRPQDRETAAIVANVVGQLLALAGEHRRLSQDDVAEVLGVSRVMVSHWERDERRPSELVLDRLAAIYGMPLRVLVDPEAPFPGSPAVADTSLVELLYRDAEIAFLDL